MQPLNLYVATVNDVRSTGKEGFSFPVKDVTTILIKGNERDPLTINGQLVYIGSGNQDYIIRLGDKGIYKFNDYLNLANSGGSIGTIAYQSKVMSSKQIQISAGSVPIGVNFNLNLTGAVKLHIIHDTNFQLDINGNTIIPGGYLGTVVIDIGNDIDIINDTITLATNGNTGFIIERLI